MDQVDLNLLKRLETDGRISFAMLAEAEGQSKTPVWKRVKAMEDQGIILGYGARIAPKQLGFELQAMVEVAVDPEASDRFEATVRRHPSIWRCHAMTGEADYLLHVLARDMDDFDRLIRTEVARWPGVKRTLTAVVTRTIKDDQSLADLAQRR